MDESIEKIRITSSNFKSDENSKLNTVDDSIDNIEHFDQIDLKIEKEEIFSKSDFYSNPVIKNKNIKTPTKTFNISYKYKKLGNTFSFCYNKEGVPLFVIGPHWPFFVCLSTTISFLCYFFFFYFWNYLHPIYITIGIILFTIQILSYIYTFLKNPGLPNYNANPDDAELRNGFKFCQDCHIFIDADKNIFHCPDCNICIVGYDHHCPWTSKCIGEGNLSGFHTFVISTMVLFGYLVFGISIAGS